MKKNFKRKNYVLIGAIGIAAVALTSVGFATWITGMQQTTVTTGDISVSVDTAENSTKYLDVVIDSSNSTMHIGEKVTSGAITNSGDPTDLEIAFTKFQLIIGDKYTSTQLEKVKVEMTVTNLPTGITFTNGGFVPTNLYGTTKNSENKSYLQFPAEFGTVTDGKFYVNMTDVAESEKSANLKGYTVKKATLETGNKLTLTWGTVFGNKKESPATYYNGRLDATQNVEEKLGIMDEATKTLNHMKDLLNGKTLTYTFTVTGLPE